MDISPETVNQIIGIILVVLVFSMFFSFDFDLKLNMPYIGCPSKSADDDRFRMAQSQSSI
jgi:hypothetical protein